MLVPVALGLGMNEIPSLHPERVCIIKPSALGDVANAFHALDALVHLWPDAQFTWVINRNLAGLVAGHPQISRVICYDRRPSGTGPGVLSAFLGVLRELNQGHFDLTIDLQGLFRSGIMTAATKAPVRVGLADAREGASWFYTHRVRPQGNRDQTHAVDRLLAIAKACGADISEPRAMVARGEADRLWAEQVLSDVRRPRLGLNLGARWATKRWPPAHFADIARRAVEALDAGLFVVGAPEDRPFVDELIERVAPSRVVDLCGRTTLPQLAALAEQADVLLSNDSGPLHLAAATGARVVGIFTCTDPLLNGPYGRRAVAVQSRVWCAGSYRVKCPRAMECMQELTPDRVWPELLAQLRGKTCSEEHTEPMITDQDRARSVPSGPRS
ncbi:MAG: lipopolysaccharide heptosyltransferase I [Isosphaeraceae bacterium]